MSQTRRRVKRRPTTRSEEQLAEADGDGPADGVEIGALVAQRSEAQGVANLDALVEQVGDVEGQPRAAQPGEAPDRRPLLAEVVEQPQVEGGDVGKGQVAGGRAGDPSHMGALAPVEGHARAVAAVGGAQLGLDLVAVLAAGPRGRGAVQQVEDRAAATDLFAIDEVEGVVDGDLKAPAGGQIVERAKPAAPASPAASTPAAAAIGGSELFRGRRRRARRPGVGLLISLEGGAQLAAGRLLAERAGVVEAPANFRAFGAAEVDRLDILLDQLAVGVADEAGRKRRLDRTAGGREGEDRVVDVA